MDSPQSVVSPFKNSTFSHEPEMQNFDHFVGSQGSLSREVEVQGKAAMSDMMGCLGILEVYIHQARDIHNICIYQKQDVYAKLCLTSDPENTVATQIINGGGKNPVFNESLRLDVQGIDSSLKCEIWMLSRVRNYLEDQLLGFALVPLSEVLISNGKLEKEFSLSSTDLFHSPAGFVQLSLSYYGSSPEVMVFPALSTSKASNGDAPNREVTESIPCEFDKIEFPDPNVVNENQQMVSEYYEMSCNSLDSHSSESLILTDTGNHLGSDTGHVVEKNSVGNTVQIPNHNNPVQIPKHNNSVQIPKRDSPPSSVSTNGSPSVSLPASCQSSDTPRAMKSPDQEYISPPKETPKEKSAEAGDAESDASGGVPTNAVAKPVVPVNIEPEQKVVQQDIVDMYMKSMQQFTESLAKMKLPVDGESGSTSSGDSSSGQELQTPKSNGSRVFYGSRAFF